jgi:hypothetical protein
MHLWSDMAQLEAHPLVPGSSTYRGGGRNLKRGVGFQFFRCLELPIRMPVAVSSAFWPRHCRDADRSQPLNALSRPPRTASSYHILDYLGQREEPPQLGQSYEISQHQLPLQARLSPAHQGSGNIQRHDAYGMGRCCVLRQAQAGAAQCQKLTRLIQHMRVNHRDVRVKGRTLIVEDDINTGNLIRT